jgi:hypothetical protein
MWWSALAAYLVASFILPRIDSALLVQAAGAASLLPFCVASLCVGAQAMLYLLGPQAIAVMLLSLTLSCVLLYRAIDTRRVLFYDLLRKRKYRRLLRSETHNWSPTFDIEQSLPGKVGLVGIGLSVSGPAIGIHLHRMIGRANANIVMVIIPYLMGLFTLFGAGFRVGLYMVEMRRIELRIGRRLTLPPYREEDEPSVD